MLLLHALIVSATTRSGALVIRSYLISQCLIVPPIIFEIDRSRFWFLDITRKASSIVMICCKLFGNVWLCFQQIVSVQRTQYDPHDNGYETHHSPRPSRYFVALLTKGALFMKLHRQNARCFCAFVLLLLILPCSHPFLPGKDWTRCDVSAWCDVSTV